MRSRCVEQGAQLLHGHISYGLILIQLEIASNLNWIMLFSFLLHVWIFLPACESFFFPGGGFPALFFVYSFFWCKILVFDILTD